jgi:hypothetical protein
MKAAVHHQAVHHSPSPQFQYLGLHHRTTLPHHRYAFVNIDNRVSPSVGVPIASSTPKTFTWFLLCAQFPISTMLWGTSAAGVQ